jgi:hypothetical protein
MKQFKLIKKYPSLPEDWQVGMIVGLGNRSNSESFSPCNSKYRDYYVPYCEVANNPEFWQEIVEYPIGTKIFNKSNKCTLIKTELGWFSDHIVSSYKDSDFIGNDNFKIIEESKILKKDSFIYFGSYELHIINVGIINYIVSFHKDKNSDYFECEICLGFKDSTIILNFSTKSFNEIKKTAKAMVKSYFKGCEEINNEKNYEILKLTNYSGDILNVNEVFDWVTGGGTICYHLERGDKIYSVKRLSDGEIFTIGDIVSHKNSKSFGTISKFRITSDNNIYVSSEDFVWGLTIDMLQKHKTPLLTTEDGVDIYISDRIWYVEPKNFIIYNSNGYKIYHYGKGSFKYFSKKEAAEEYVFENKPYLSLKEVEGILLKCKNTLSPYALTITNLKQLIKNKNRNEKKNNDNC